MLQKYSLQIVFKKTKYIIKPFIFYVMKVFLMLALIFLSQRNIAIILEINTSISEIKRNISRYVNIIVY